MTLRLILSSVGLSVLAGCQAAPEKETSEPPKEEALAEETFDSGDTGELEANTDKPAETEEEPLDDPQ